MKVLVMLVFVPLILIGVAVGFVFGMARIGWSAGSSYASQLFIDVGFDLIKGKK